MRGLVLALFSYWRKQCRGKKKGRKAPEIRAEMIFPVPKAKGADSESGEVEGSSLETAKSRRVLRQSVPMLSGGHLCAPSSV